MMCAFTGPLHLFCALVSRINQGLNVGFGDLTRIGFVGLSTRVIINNIGLIPMEILIQACPLNLSHFVEDQNDPSTSQILPSWPSVQWWGRAPPVRSVPPVQRRSADESCAGTERTPRILTD